MIFQLFNDETMELVVDPKKKHFIMLSGGFDSAVLLFCLTKAMKEHGIVPQPVMVVPEDAHTLDSGNAIVAMVNRILGVEVPQVMPAGDIHSHHSQKVNSAIHEITGKYGDSTRVKIWQAITKNPPVKLSPMDGTPEYRPQRVKSHSDLISSPFATVVKSYVVDLANRMGILDEVATLTTSCTNYQPTGRCHACFQCRERLWAFRAMLLRDAGVK